MVTTTPTETADSQSRTSNNNNNNNSTTSRTRTSTSTTSVRPPEKEEELECLLCAETQPSPAGVGFRFLHSLLWRLCGCGTRTGTGTAVVNQNQWRRRPCCSQTCCDACLYRHMTTIWEEALTGGQRPLNCPAGCGQPLSDAEIRSCLHNHHYTWLWHDVLGRTLYGLWKMTTLLEQVLHWCCSPCDWWRFFLVFFLGCCGGGSNGDGNRPSSSPTDSNSQQQQHQQFRWTQPPPSPGSIQSDVPYRLWWYLSHTESERQDLLRYEKWSLSRGFRDLMTNATSTNTTTTNAGLQIQHCPAPNCDYAWIVANPAYRQQKRLHERRRVFLWYNPLPPEDIVTNNNNDNGDNHDKNRNNQRENDNNSENNNDFHLWVEPEYLHFGTTSPQPAFFASSNHNPEQPPRCIDSEHPQVTGPRSKQDGRRMVCAKCHYVFCGLCRQPWMLLRQYHGRKSCRTYQQQCLPAVGGGRNNNNEDWATVAAHTIGARPCPGCQTLTCRAGGCNHITCPCGSEWCFVCGARWTPWHYRCVSRDPHERRLLNNNGNDAAMDCVIL